MSFGAVLVFAIAARGDETVTVLLVRSCPNPNEHGCFIVLNTEKAEEMICNSVQHHI